MVKALVSAPNADNVIDYDALSRALESGLRSKAPIADMARRTQLGPEAPAPHLEALVAERGLEPTTEALEAWNARVAGEPIIDVARHMGISIELAKKLIGEVHAAIAEDLKEGLDRNRQLDLARVEGIVRAFYPSATQGDAECADVVLRALKHRAKLCGIEPMPEPGRSQPQNVLIWIQQQMPQINRLVDSLPMEMP